MSLYYVDVTNGANGNNGLSTGAAWKTLKYAFLHTTAGDFISLRAGVYPETISVVDGDTIPSGSSGSPITIQNYPGETVTLAPTGNVHDTVLYLYGTSYTTWKNIIIDATGIQLNYTSTAVAINAGSSHNIFDTVEVKNSPGNNIQMSGASNFNQFLSCLSHDAGTYNARGHGIYFTGGLCTDSLIDGGSYYNNAKYGVHQYENGFGHMDRTIVRNTRIYHNGYVGSTPTTSISCWGMLLGDGDNMLAYNNLIYGNSAGGIQLTFNTSNGVGIYNNCLFNNSNDPSAGPGYGSPSMEVGGAVTNLTVRNNIIYGNYSDTIDNSGAGAGYTADHNMFTTPLWTNASGGDFTLLAGSGAIGAGYDLSGTFTTDKNGVNRTVPFDCGAYKAVSRKSNLSILGLG